jgi:hypothetical protein
VNLLYAVRYTGTVGVPALLHMYTANLRVRYVYSKVRPASEMSWTTLCRIMGHNLSKVRYESTCTHLDQTFAHTTDPLNDKPLEV